MEHNEQLEAEKNELNSLINRGVKFSVEETLLQKQKGFWGLFKKRVPVKVQRTFTIEEPTLRTLDLITAEALEMPIDENILSGENGLSEAKQLTNQYIERCARVVALAVLGSDYVQTLPKSNGTVKTIYNEKELKRLTELFCRTIKPSKLMQLTLLVNTMLNLGDFINSIRLITANRTTMPGRVEKKQKV